MRGEFIAVEAFAMTFPMCLPVAPTTQGVLTARSVRDNIHRPVPWLTCAN